MTQTNLDIIKIIAEDVAKGLTSVKDLATCVFVLADEIEKPKERVEGGGNGDK